MDWNKVLENSVGPLFGSFAGAGAALSSLWIKDRLDRSRSVQEWFEQKYVLGAINPVIELLQRWTQMILHQESQTSLRVDFLELPHLEITRLNSILRTSSFNSLFYLLSNIVFQTGANIEDDDGPVIDWAHIAGKIQLLLITIMELQSQLLAVRISRKTDIARLHLRKEIAAVRHRIDDQMVGLLKGYDVFRLRTETSQAFKELANWRQRLRDSMTSGSTPAMATALRDELNTLKEKAKREILPHSMQDNLDVLSGLLDQFLLYSGNHPMRSEPPGSDA